MGTQIIGLELYIVKMVLTIVLKALFYSRSRCLRTSAALSYFNDPLDINNVLFFAKQLDFPTRYSKLFFEQQQNVAQVIRVCVEQHFVIFVYNTVLKIQNLQNR